jgi:gluconolactonase
MAGNLTDIMESSEPQRVAAGFGGEGPVWHPKGYWLFSGSASVVQLVPGGQPEVIHRETHSLGLTFDLQGRLLMCGGITAPKGGRWVSRVEPDGTITKVADSWRGKRLARPNDIVCRSDGSIYFTNMGRSQDPALRLREEVGFGVFRVAPDGGVEPVVTDMEMPNGLAFSPNERILYVANTGVPGPDNEFQRQGVIPIIRERMNIRAFDVAPNGSLAKGRVFADMTTRLPPPSPGRLGPDSKGRGEGVPDGMKVDVEGRVYCIGPGGMKGPGGLWVFEPSGRHLGTIEFPEQCTNCAWGGGPDYRTLLVTARTSLYELPMKVRGVVPPGARALMG